METQQKRKNYDHKVGTLLLIRHTVKCPLITQSYTFLWYIP